MFSVLLHVSLICTCQQYGQKGTLAGHDQAVTCIAFLENSDTLLSGSDDKTLRLWNASRNVLLNKIPNHETIATSISSFKTLTVIGNHDGTLRTYATQKSYIKELNEKKLGSIKCISVNTLNGDKIAVAFVLPVSLNMGAERLDGRVSILEGNSLDVKRTVTNLNKQPLVYLY